MEKMKNKTKKKKEIQLPMKFNPGLEMFQPQLPLADKSNKKIKMKINWWAYVYLLIVILLLISWITLAIFFK